MTDPAIHLPRLTPQVATVPIVGTAPLISNRWTDKARQQMRDAQMGKPKIRKAPKDPEADYAGSMYATDDGSPAFPAVAFKAAIVDGARYFDGVTQVLLKQAVFVRGAGPEMLVPIDGKPEMVEHMVRNATGVADIRYRCMYPEWRATLTIEFVAAVLTVDSVLALLDAGGRGGIGEWRPSAPKSKTGQYGTFRVADEDMS